MVRCSQALLLLGVAITCLPVHKPAAATTMPAAASVVHGDEPRGRGEEKETAGHGASGDGGAAWGGHGVVSRQRPTTGATAVPRLKLARRLLIGNGVDGGGAAGADSGARPSCGSNNARIGCAPPSPR
ncbi:hypothetical protein ACP70R_025294 [Stipagrostis hirtigluma subsp. patula]